MQLYFVEILERLLLVGAKTGMEMQLVTSKPDL